jgi:anti-sigma-K factor RskA
MEYQLWIVKNKKPLPSSTFRVIAGKEETVACKLLDVAVNDKKDADSFAVTLEPKGGSLQPTGQMYLIGSPLVY